MENFKAVVSYDGTRYNGWQVQKNTKDTIQGKLEALLFKLTGEQVDVIGSGRTDAGVHARMQTCNFHAHTERSCDSILHELRSHLPEDIGALSLEEAPERFHARLNCNEKTYVYRLVLGDAPIVFDRNYVARFPDSVQIDEMRRAAELLVGEHDFSAFTSSRHMKKSAVRKLKRISVEWQNDELTMTLTGDGFLYNMVRIIVGTLLEIGTGERRAEEIPDVIRSRKRENAGFTAPAKGLTLWEEKY